MKKDEIYRKIKNYYPLDYEKNLLPKFILEYFKILKTKVKKDDFSRIDGKFGRDYYKRLIKKFSFIPMKIKDPLSVSKKIVNDLFEGILRWRSPNLEHNVGSPVNTVSSAIYSLALDENIYNIDDGLSGNSLVAEIAICRILSKLAKLKKIGVGFFVFGGTATNFYATKIGLKKAAPKSGNLGIPRNICAFVTEDSHFTHSLSADWLGLGTKNLITIKANKDRTSNIQDAKEKMESALKSGKLISSILVNGGTTYNHTVDDLKKFVDLRDYIVKKYSLKYKPHVHVDSVIGWSWLFFNYYNFKTNPLEIKKQALNKLKLQNKKISQLKYADSWGVDFHKGIGGCPVNCSIIMFNNPQDIDLISKIDNPLLETHQLASELNYFSPADYTLETSRSGGTALSALACVHSLGFEGYQRNLANLIEGTCIIRDGLSKNKQIFIVNEYSLGFSTMVRLYPPELKNDKRKFCEFKKDDKKMDKFIIFVNDYIKKFYKWDYETRILKNIGPSYSFSSGFIKIRGNKVSAIKIYPTSPHFNEKYAEDTAKTLIKQKEIFDREIWQKKK